MDVPHVCRSGLVVFSPPGVSDYYGGIDWLSALPVCMVGLAVVLLLDYAAVVEGIDRSHVCMLGAAVA